MRINQIISEAISTSYPYEMGMDNAQFYDSAGNSYYVRFDDFGNSVWSVAFQTGAQSVDEPTNRHDAFRVFATVISVIKAWADSANPRVLIFSANRNSESRVSLYAKLAEKFTEHSQYVYLHNVSDISDMILAYKIKALIDSVPQDRFKTYTVIHRSLLKSHDRSDQGKKK